MGEPLHLYLMLLHAHSRTSMVAAVACAADPEAARRLVWYGWKSTAGIEAIDIGVAAPGVPAGRLGDLDRDTLPTDLILAIRSGVAP